MAKVKCASSINPNSAECGIELAKAVKSELKAPAFAFVYLSCDYDLEKVSEGIKKVLPDLPFIGNTSFKGVMTGDGYISTSGGFAAIMAVEDPDLQLVISASEKKGSAYETGAGIASKAISKHEGEMPSYFYMSASAGEEESYLRGISSVIGRRPFFGGTAADNTISGNWKLFTNEGIFSEGCAAVFFFGKSRLANVFTGAYRESSDMGVITETRGNRTIVSIDGVPALERYAGWRGLSESGLKGGDILIASVNSPLGVKDRLGLLTAIRHPMFANDDKSINVGNDVAVGTGVVRCEASTDELIKSAPKNLKALLKKMHDPLYLHLVHCGGRFAVMDGREEELYRAIKDAVGDIPFILEFTFGEYGCESDDRNTCGGLMLSFSGIEK